MLLCDLKWFHMYMSGCVDDGYLAKLKDYNIQGQALNVNLYWRIQHLNCHIQSNKKIVVTQFSIANPNVYV